jgi:hypothetical protein
MPRVPRKSADRTIGVKYPIEIDARIKRVTEALAQQSPVPVPLTFVMCQIASRGLEVYERELGIGPKPGKANSPKAA